MILVVYAHPKTKGNGYEILQEVKKRKCEVLDLYAMKFDPVLRDNELYTAGKDSVSKKVLEIQKKIKKADGIVFIYPVWWGTMPAILKGFFDRVFTAPFAFEYVKKPIIGAVPKGNIKKKAVVFLTTGAKKWQSLLLGNRFKHVIKNDILEFCGINAKVFQFGGAERWDENRRPEIQEMVRKGLTFLSH
ncbi:NAD(P)H-dependent oxidoreductase [Candidatus Woesearchaeota archaeon]|nr:NAD(P)H-dependent oxidoreductase [Candidatus Woesearchaeota archaeon]